MVHDEEEGAEDWLDEHGNPDYAFLKSLADEGTMESMEELRAIADEHDIPHTEVSTAQELVDQIMMVLNEETGHEAM